MFTCRDGKGGKLSSQASKVLYIWSGLYLALIKRARGLYGRILTEVVSTGRTHDRGQDSPIQTDLDRLIRCLLYGENKSKLIRSM